MDNPTTLLVAIMFVTIVVTGIVNILMFLSNLLAGESRASTLHTSWVILLLVIYLCFFWQAKLILEIDGWQFQSFIVFILGPIALLFAGNLASVGHKGDKQTELDQFYFSFSKRFFLLMLFVQAWGIGLDITFESVDFVTYLDGLIGVLFVVLAISRNDRLHVAGAVLAWPAFLARAALLTL
jgi:hypothetical protein